MKITPRQAVERIVELAPEMLREDRPPGPMLYVFGEEQDGIVLLDFREPGTKHQVMEAAGAKVEHVLPYCIALVCESWMSRTIPPEGIEVSDLPDRQECLLATAQNREGETESAAVPFSRVGGQVFMDEAIYAESAESYLLGSFWKGVRGG